MRIAVVNVTSGGMSGGYRKYLSRLMPLIGSDPRVERLTVFVPAAVGRLTDDPAVDERPMPDGDAALAREVAALGVDVVFVPTARHVAVGSAPVVTMVRNMEPLTVPFGGNTLKEGAKNLARAWEAKRACRKAARVIAVSRHVREFLIDRWTLPADRIGLVYHGVDAVAPSGAQRALRACTAGSIRPARGLEDAVSALGEVPRLHLTIAGAVDRGCEAYGARLRRLAAERGVADRITWAGQLAPGAMLRLYEENELFVMTSRAEACPNTTLEAMSAGCAVVSDDRPPMPEFFGDAAMYYPAGEPSRLASRLNALLDDPATRERLGHDARARAASFTWETTRDRTIEELQRAVS
jgi:glycosyltransferase involved in cell wall biosynthesis